MPSIGEPAISLDGYTLFRHDRVVPQRGVADDSYVISLYVPTNVVIDAQNSYIDVKVC